MPTRPAERPEIATPSFGAAVGQGVAGRDRTSAILLVGLTIALGLVADRFGGPWGQPLVSVWVWGLCGGLLYRDAPLRSRLVAKLQARLNDYAWEMVPSKYVDELSRPRKADTPMIWGMNPVRHGATSETDSRRDPSLTVERADQPGK